VHQLFIDFNLAYDSVRREVLYNILFECGIPMKLVRLIKMCLTESQSRFRVGKDLPDMFPIRNGLKQFTNLLSLSCNVCRSYQMEDIGMGNACSMCCGEERYTEGFGWGT
jgi:hypothetical protein